MYLILLTMHDPDLLEELLIAWAEAGVSGATVMFSTGMGRLCEKAGMRDDFPLMPSLDDFYKISETLSRTIYTAVKEEAMIDAVLTATQRVVGDLTGPQTGIFLVLPITRGYGLEKGEIP